MQSLNIASTGMAAQQLNVEVISNNIANMNTTGYKRQRAEFQDLLYQDQRRVGTNSSDAGTIVPSGIQLGVGVKTAATYRINEQGALTLTENNLDLAIRGQGQTGQAANTHPVRAQANGLHHVCAAHHAAIEHDLGAALRSGHALGQET